jgi:flagellar biogenesis protein FliO
MRRVATAAVFCIILCGAVRAAESFDETRLIPAPGSGYPARVGDKSAAAGKSREKKSGSSWWTTLGSLTAVLALIYLTAKVLRKGMPAAQRTLPAEVMQVLGRKPLDYRNTIHLVRCGSRLLVIGSSQAGLAPLSEISDPQEVDHLAGLCKASEPGSAAETFSQLFRKFQAPEETEPTGEIEPVPDSDPAVLRLQARLSQPGGINTNDEHDDRFEEVAG